MGVDLGVGLDSVDISPPLGFGVGLDSVEISPPLGFGVGLDSVEISLPLGFEPQTILPIASYYTNYAILAAQKLIV
jgi:hypothetical protein